MLGTAIAAGANLIGGLIGGNQQKQMAEKNIRLQKDFAQQGIRWKVADAKAAGLHPLAALGAQTMSFSPVSVGGGLGEGLATAGQDIGRAINATRTSGERVDAYSAAVQGLNLKRMELENQLLGSQIAKLNQAGSPPPFPSPGDRYLVEGQPGSGLISSQPLSRTQTGSAPSQEPGAIPGLGFERTPTGWSPLMSKDVKERLEEDNIGSFMWSVRNRLYPTFGANLNPPADIPGARWIYDPKMQEYRRVDRPPGLYSRPSRGRYGFERYYR